jgi:hypothetical protein
MAESASAVNTLQYVAVKQEQVIQTVWHLALFADGPKIFRPCSAWLLY